MISGQMRTQTWFQVAGELRASLARQPLVQNAPSRRRPTAEEISPMSSRRATGYEYRFRVGGVIAETGEPVVVFHAVRRQQLVRISEAAAIAVNTAALIQARYERSFEPEDVVLDSVFELHPGAEE
jgi:hypothetical protein